MGQLAQRFDFSELEAFLPTTVLLLHLFDSHNLVCLSVEGLEYSPEGSVSQYFNYVIFLHPL